MFTKYNSIENHYDEKNLAWWLNQFPEMKDAAYVLQEKVHGANFQVIIPREGAIQIGKRSGLIEPGENFYGAWATFARYQDRFLKVQEFLDGTPWQEFILHGEYFGGKIQKGVRYGEEKRFLFFDVRVDGVLWPYKKFTFLMDAIGLGDLQVPVLGVVKGLKLALEQSCDFDSLILGEVDNPSEGFVLKPYDTVFKVPGQDRDNVFSIKKKSAAFLEKKSVKKKPKLDRSVSKEAALLRAELLAYLVPERLNGIFSKNGEIQSAKQIGKFIKLFVEDAVEDFKKEHGEAFDKLSNKEQKYVVNVGGKAAPLVKAAL